MGLLGFLKDVVLLPMDIAQDITGIGLIKRGLKDDYDSEDTGLDSLNRLKSMGENWEETYKE